MEFNLEILLRPLIMSHYAAVGNLNNYSLISLFVVSLFVTYFDRVGCVLYS